MGRRAQHRVIAYRKHQAQVSLQCFVFFTRRFQVLVSSSSFTYSLPGKMTTAVYSFSLLNPRNGPTNYSRRAAMALYRSPTESSLRPFGRVCLVSPAVSSRRFDLGLFSPHPSKLKEYSVFALSASHEEPSSEIEEEKKKNDIKAGVEESEEAWKETLASFKEQALKMKSISQEAYEVYSKKAVIVLKETSEQLKIQAEKVREDLAVIALEISEDGKQYLSTAAENSPEPVKEIVETFASSSNNLEVSKVRDFYIGIPYGFLLSFGGFLSFMITGSISAIRFGVILGGSLLALSVLSLRSWKRGESSTQALKGQTAIASILFLRELCKLIGKSSFVNLTTCLISGGIVAFYIYRIITNSEHTKESSFEPGTQE